MYERKIHPLAPRHKYFKRLLKSFAFASVFLGFSLMVGVFGYHFMGKLSWIDSLLNASMILGGMGPADMIVNKSGKLFASFYALYSGISFLTAFAILIAPALHRLLHRFHLDTDE